jgi:Tfp pilus assembly protein PilO
MEMANHNGKTRIAIISLCVTIIVVLVGWGSSFLTAKMKDARAEQEVMDTIESHTGWIEKHDKDIEQLKEDTTRIDERTRNIEKQLEKQDTKLDKILERL